MILNYRCAISPRLFAVLLLSALLTGAGCDNGEGSDAVIQETESEQPEHQQPAGRTTSPEEFAATAEPIEWEIMRLLPDPLWSIKTAHIGILPPPIVETAEDAVVAVHSVAGVLGYDMESGRELWGIEDDVLHLDLSEDYLLRIFTESGFRVLLEPFSGEVQDRRFAGLPPVPEQWGAEYVRSRFRPEAVRVGRNTIAVYPAEEIPEEERVLSDVTVDVVIDGYGEIALIPGEDDSILSDNGAFSVPFSVAETGRYEVFALHAEGEAVLFRVVSPTGDVLGENQDYGGLMSGFSVRLQAEVPYLLQAQPTPGDLPPEPIEFAVSLLL